MLPQIYLKKKRGDYLDAVEEHKVLKYILRSDLKTLYNTEYFMKKSLPSNVIDN